MLLQQITGSKAISFFDGFSGYNQVLVKKDDSSKTLFTTSWDTFEYIRMPFGLQNVGTTFQRAMDYTFPDIIKNINEVY